MKGSAIPSLRKVFFLGERRKDGSWICAQHLHFMAGLLFVFVEGAMRCGGQESGRGGGEGKTGESIFDAVSSDREAGDPGLRPGRPAKLTLFFLKGVAE